MKTTIEVPDDLYRRAKAEAALRGRKLRDLIEEGLRLGMTEAKIFQHLSNPWMTTAEVRRLRKNVERFLRKAM